MLQARTTLRRASHRKGSHGGETREEEGKLSQVEVVIFKKTDIRDIALYYGPIPILKLHKRYLPLGPHFSRTQLFQIKIFGYNSSFSNTFGD